MSFYTNQLSSLNIICRWRFCLAADIEQSKELDRAGKSRWDKTRDLFSTYIKNQHWCS